MIVVRIRWSSISNVFCVSFDKEIKMSKSLIPKSLKFACWQWYMLQLMGTLCNQKDFKMVKWELCATKRIPKWFAQLFVIYRSALQQTVPTLSCCNKDYSFQSSDQSSVLRRGKRWRNVNRTGASLMYHLKFSFHFIFSFQSACYNAPIFPRILLASNGLFVEDQPQVQFVVPFLAAAWSNTFDVNVSAVVGYLLFILR